MHLFRHSLVLLIISSNINITAAPSQLAIRFVAATALVPVLKGYWDYKAHQEQDLRKKRDIQEGFVNGVRIGLIPGLNLVAAGVAFRDPSWVPKLLFDKDFKKSDAAAITGFGSAFSLYATMPWFVRKCLKFAKK